MIKVVRGDMTYYYSSMRHVDNAMQSCKEPDGSIRPGFLEYKLMQLADFAINRRSNELVKCRTDVESVFESGLRVDAVVVFTE